MRQAGNITGGEIKEVCCKGHPNNSTPALGTCPCSLQICLWRNTPKEVKLLLLFLLSHPFPVGAACQRCPMAAQTLPGCSVPHVPQHPTATGTCWQHPWVPGNPRQPFDLWARLVVEDMSPVVPACSIPGSFPQKGCGLRGARPRCSAAGCVRGSAPGARGEGKGPGLAQLILASARRKLGAGGSPGFPLGQRWARFISTPAPAAHAGEQAATVGKEERREPGVSRHGTARQGTPARAGDQLARHGSACLEDNVGQRGGGPDRPLRHPALLQSHAGQLPPG